MIRKLKDNIKKANGGFSSTLILDDHENSRHYTS